MITASIRIETEKEIRGMLKRAKNKWEQRRIQCVLLRVSQKLTAEKVGEIVGIHTASVWRIWSRYIRGGIKNVIGEKRGGRYHAALTGKEEKIILESFKKRAAKGELVTIRDVHKAVCRKSGVQTALSTTYRLLHRHGWRKVMPRLHHPKGDTKEQEQFKVFFPQNRYCWTR
jgi:transposase